MKNQDPRLRIGHFPHAEKKRWRQIPAQLLVQAEEEEQQERWDSTQQGPKVSVDKVWAQREAAPRIKHGERDGVDEETNEKRAQRPSFRSAGTSETSETSECWWR